MKDINERAQPTDNSKIEKQQELLNKTLADCARIHLDVLKRNIKQGANNLS
jgi:hypothetical protein